MLSLARGCFFMQMRIKKADGKMGRWEVARRMKMGYAMLHWKESECTLPAGVRTGFGGIWVPYFRHTSYGSFQ
jgi:hypothetical protein